LARLAGPPPASTWDSWATVDDHLRPRPAPRTSPSGDGPIIASWAHERVRASRRPDLDRASRASNSALPTRPGHEDHRVVGRDARPRWRARNERLGGDREQPSSPRVWRPGRRRSGRSTATVASRRAISAPRPLAWADQLAIPPREARTSPTRSLGKAVGGSRESTRPERHGAVPVARGSSARLVQAAPTRSSASGTPITPVEATRRPSTCRATPPRGPAAGPPLHLGPAGLPGPRAGAPFRFLARRSPGDHAQGRKVDSAPMHSATGRG